jgi:predicted nuclease of predicted toxin-antitoxin system
MARLFADENVPHELADLLSAQGHDIITALAAGRANQSIPNPDVLAHATLLGRAILTNNAWDFHKLHRANAVHAGIITYADDPDLPALAQRIDAKIAQAGVLAGKLLTVYRPP